MSDCENIWEVEPEQDSVYDGPCATSEDNFISLGGLQWITLGSQPWVDKE